MGVQKIDNSSNPLQRFGRCVTRVLESGGVHVRRPRRRAQSVTDYTRFVTSLEGDKERKG